MLCHQMDAIVLVAMQNSFHLNCVTHPLPLREKRSSVISLSRLVHSLLFWNIIETFQGLETKTCFARCNKRLCKRVSAFSLQNKA